MKSYKRLTYKEREVISQRLSSGKGIPEISEELGRHRTSVRREIQQRSGKNGRYFACEAQECAEVRAGSRNTVRKIDKHPRLWSVIKEKLALRWSPQQIATMLTQMYPDDKRMHVSHETIYTYLYLLPRGALRKELLRYLRQKKRLRRNRKRGNDNRGVIPEMISIEERPKEVEERIIPGHWEGDLIMGKRHQSALGTIVERTTRTVILVPLVNKDAVSVRRAFAKEMKKLPRQMALTLTYDRGKEMAEHKLFTKQTKMQVYFCHPNSPWERGTNENTNLLIRDFFPKGTDFKKVSRREIKKVQRWLNERPRKTLGWKTPKAVFHSLLR